jgi:hypothetical protein
MNKPKASRLKQELLAAGATASESRDLLALAGQLHDLPTGSPAIPKTRGRWLQFSAAGIVVVLLVSLVALSQSSLPGNWLYSVKRASESSLALVDPSYKGTIMMRRSQEVKTLIARHAAATQVLATLADYQTAAAAYQTADYSVFSDCKQNLQTAEIQASPEEKQAIAATLYSLRNVD